MLALRARGWTVGVVERRHGGKSHDLFGMWDILAMRDGRLIAVQATSGSNVAARMAKVRSAEALLEWRLLAATRSYVVGWRLLKVGKRRLWRARWVRIT